VTVQRESHAVRYDMRDPFHAFDVPYVKKTVSQVSESMSEPFVSVGVYPTADAKGWTSEPRRNTRYR